jgi:hypothetical protein
MPYSAVTQPSPLPFLCPGTFSSTDAVHSTRVWPNSTSTDPSAWMVKPRVSRTVRSWLAARTPLRECAHGLEVRRLRATVWPARGAAARVCQDLRKAERRMASLISAIDRSIAASSRSSTIVSSTPAWMVDANTPSLMLSVEMPRVDSKLSLGFPTPSRSRSRCRCASPRGAELSSTSSGTASDTDGSDNSLTMTSSSSCAPQPVGTQHESCRLAAASLGPVTSKHRFCRRTQAGEQDVAIHAVNA